MENYLTISFMGDEPVKISREKTLLELSREYQDKYKYPILLAKVNNKLVELNNKLFENGNVQFLDITDANGYRTYQRSIVFLMVYAAKCVLGKKTRVIVKHSINKNYFCEIPEEEIEITDELLQKIETKMHDLVEDNIPIEKHNLSVEAASRYVAEYGLNDKFDILRYRPTSNANFYKLKDFYNYFYGQMVPSTGYLTMFKLHKNEGGFILQFPATHNPSEYSELKLLKKVFGVFRESSNWAKIMKVDTVGALNNITCAEGLNDIMLISEALHEKKIAYIADMIFQGKKNVILIAGPSSSGKTTFAHRLCIQLRVNGIKPYLISLDNYFFNRDNAPIDEFGKADFDSFLFMDAEQLNKDLKRLLNGEKIEIPQYNFQTGMREYNGKTLKLAKDEVLIMEGIHALNEKMTYSIMKDHKFKVFVSALTQLNMDDHNRIPTTDTRLIRRIVRDHKFRGTAAANTISQWPSVVKGEALNIFPYQEEADVFFNSALVYELCVLKQYVEPLLFKIDSSMEQYTEARRLIKFLNSFLVMSSEHLPPNSILREFIGGGCFCV